MTNYDRALPHAPEMEKALLGTMIRHPERLRAASTSIPIEAFHLETHRLLYGVLLNRLAEKKPTDLYSVFQSIMESGNLERFGGPAEITETAGAGDAMANLYWEHLEAGVLTRWQAREIIRAAQELQQAAWTNPESVPEQINAILPRLQLCAKGKGTMLSMRELLVDAANRWEDTKLGRRKGVSTGFPKLDALTGGLMPGELVVICGETKSGKTALAVQMACAAVKKGHPAAIFSLEMSDGELVDRIVSSESGLPAIKFRTGNFHEQDFIPLGHTLAELTPWPLWITHQVGSLAGIQSECRRLKGEARVVVVDYIQLVESTYRRGETREQQVAGISRALKALATECEMTVIGLSQLNEEGKVRESRAIAQDANLVLAVDRCAEEDCRELRVVVQRSGPSGGKVDLRFRGENVRFE